MRLTLLTAIILSTFIVGFGKDRKDPKYCCLCENHVACPRTHIDDKCKGDFEFVEMTAADIQDGLQYLNVMRFELAFGLIRGFQTASNMKEMFWSEELATLAEITALQCDAVHDQCRATKQFMHPGQNIFIDTTPGAFGLVGGVFKSATFQWKRERVLTNQAQTVSLPSNIEDLPGRNFLQAIYSQVTHVGCGAVRYVSVTEGASTNQTILVCNFSHKPVINQPVYTTGPPPLSCPSGNQTYPGLCP